MAGEAGTIASDALSGAGLGAAAGPYGALIGGVIGAGLGVYQAYGQKSDPVRPKYTIPDAIKQNLTMAQQRALQGLPAEQQELFIQNLNRGTSYGLRELSSRNGGLAGVAELNQQRNDSLGQLNAANSQARLQNEKDLMGVNNEVAGYTDQAWKLNEQNPYYETVARNQAQRGANVQNATRGLQAFGQSYGTGNQQPRFNPYTGQPIGAYSGAGVPSWEGSNLSNTFNNDNVTDIYQNSNGIYG